MVEQWSVSRSVVRDAIRTVESKGLVEVRQGIGAVVKDDVRDAFARALDLLIERGQYHLLELLQLRVLIEAQVARLAAQNATPRDLDLIEQALDRHLKAVQNNDVSGMVEADRSFHVRVIQATHNRPLIDLFAPFVHHLIVKTVVSVNYDRARHEEDNAKHRRVFEAIKASDPDEAARWLSVTFKDSFQTLSSIANESSI
jgi:DNA-binding FadR family transcriptional regulator